MSSDAIPVRDKDAVPFRCRRCGACCRDIEDELMLEPLDAYRLAAYFSRQSGGTYMGSVERVYSWFTHSAVLEGIFPIFLLNTRGSDAACTFLENGRCSVYEARPRVCRVYPFQAVPETRGGGFAYYQCMDSHRGHFSMGHVTVQAWMDQNFLEEDRMFLREMEEVLPRLGGLLRRLSKAERRRRSYQVLSYYYFRYSLERPFLPQYQENMRRLCEELQMAGLGGE